MKIIDNKLIAEFMGSVNGLYQFQNYNTDFVYGIEELEFHDSWNWLMPAVEKVRSIMREWHDNKIDDIGDKKIIAGLLTVNIDATYNGVVEFIKWYNKEGK